MNNALLHNNFNFNFSNQHSNPPAWKCGPFPKDSSNFLDFLVFSVFFFWPQFCPKLALWRVLELCWVQGLSGWILGAGRAQRRNEENRGGTPGESRRLAGENRGPMTQEREKRGESRRHARRNEEKRGALTPARPGAPPAPPSGGFQAIPGRFVSFLVLFCFYGGNFSFSRNLPAVSVRLACGMATLR